jgi:hypothetical protein
MFKSPLILSKCLSSSFMGYASVSQTMVRGPQVVLEVCPWGPSKKIKEKIKFKLISYHTIAENIRVWKLQMAVVFRVFSQYWHFMKIITLPAYRLPTLLSATNEGFKALWPWCFSQSFPCKSGAAVVTHPGTNMNFLLLT